MSKMGVSLTGEGMLLHKARQRFQARLMRKFYIGRYIQAGWGRHNFILECVRVRNVDKIWGNVDVQHKDNVRSKRLVGQNDPEFRGFKFVSSRSLTFKTSRMVPLNLA